MQHDWLEMREFMASSRVSYALQMWKLQLRGLLFDMNKYCSARLCEDVCALTIPVFPHLIIDLFSFPLQVIGSVLFDCAVEAAGRYLGITPSRLQTAHLRSDVVFLIATVQSFVYYAPAHRDALNLLLAGLMSSVGFIVAPIEEVRPHYCALECPLDFVTNASDCAGVPVPR